MYKNLSNCMVSTVYTQGVRGLFKGVSASLLRQGPYSYVRMCVYETFKRHVYQNDSPSFMQKVYAAAVGGALGCLVGTPGEILKIRLINDLKGEKYNGIVDCWRKAMAEGPSGLLKGLSVNIARTMIVNATELVTYDETKHALAYHLNMPIDSLPTYFLAALTSGLISSIVSSPIDVVKTRYMNQLKGNTQAPIYSSALDCATQIYRLEGAAAFYKGIMPLYFRNGPWAVVFFITYEEFKQLILPVSRTVL